MDILSIDKFTTPDGKNGYHYFFRDGKVVVDQAIDDNENRRLSYAEVDASLKADPTLLGKAIAPTKEETDAALRGEMVALLAKLDATRYHLDIAAETGVPVWPQVLEERAAARARISEIKGLLG